MAKTLIGELILRFKDDSSAGAKKSAAEITSSLGKIEAAAKRMNEMPWGGKFTQQLDKLGASYKDIDHLRTSWDRLYNDMQSKNLSKALQKSEMGNWKNAALQHFVQQQKTMRDEFDKSEKRARSWRDSMQNITKAGLGLVGAYGLGYMGIAAGRGGIEASADWEREKFRLAQTGYSTADQEAAIRNSQSITMKYPQISGTQALELTKSSIAATGGATEGVSVAQILARAQAVYQSQGKDADLGAEMAKFTKGGELAGLIKPGPGGQERFKTALENWVKFSQIEGQYMSMSDFFTMTRRAKGALAGASDEFIAMLPALGVDMTAPGAGTGLASLNSAFNGNVGSGNGKHNFEEQKRLGIRDENGLIGADEYRDNAFLWAQKYLIPAMRKDGQNPDNAKDVQAEMTKLIGNGMARSLLQTMVTNRASLQKTFDQAHGAVGLDAADQARYKDPFSGWMAFINSLKNLAAAVGEGPMGTAVAGLNAMTDGINRMQAAWRDGGALAKAGIGAGVAGGAFGAWKAVSSVWALATAGPALNAAAVSLEAAAGSIVAANGGGAIKNAAAASGGLLSVFGGWAGMLAGGLGLASSMTLGGDGELGSRQSAVKKLLEEEAARYIAAAQAGANSPKVPYGSLGRDPGAHGDALSGPVGKAQAAGGMIQKALSVTAAPRVDTASIDAAIVKAHELARVLGVAASAARQSTNFDLPSTTGARSVSKEMNRSFADIGVMP